MSQPELFGVDFEKRISAGFFGLYLRANSHDHCQEIKFGLVQTSVLQSDNLFCCSSDLRIIMITTERLSLVYFQRPGCNLYFWGQGKGPILSTRDLSIYRRIAYLFSPVLELWSSFLYYRTKTFTRAKFGNRISMKSLLLSEKSWTITPLLLWTQNSQEWCAIFITHIPVSRSPGA